MSTSHPILEANCAFSVHLVTSLNINQNPVKFEAVDMNICDGYDPATGNLVLPLSKSLKALILKSIVYKVKAIEFFTISDLPDSARSGKSKYQF